MRLGDLPKYVSFADPAIVLRTTQLPSTGERTMRVLVRPDGGAGDSTVHRGVFHTVLFREALPVRKGLRRRPNIG